MLMEWKGQYKAHKYLIKVVTTQDLFNSKIRIQKLY